MSVLQIGFGNFGRKWTDQLIRSDKVELKGIVESSASSRSNAKSEFGIDAFPTFEDALREVDIRGSRCLRCFEAVLIVTPAESHAAIAKTALESGKHVLTEKPLSNNLEEARRVVAQAASLRRLLMVNQQYRFHPAVRTIASLIRAGEIGELLYIRCRFDRDVQRSLPASDFRITMEHGFLVDMGVHHIDLLRALTGQEIIRVYA